MKVKILVFDDHFAVREGTKSILDSVEEFDVDVFNPPFSIDAVNHYDFSNIDLILMDLNLGENDANGIGLSQEILKMNSDIKIIIYTGYNVSDYWDEAIQAGIYGVINKSESKETVIDYIKHVLEGNIVVNFKRYQRTKLDSDRIAESTDSYGSPAKTITEREKSILIELEKGLTNQEIADKLHLSKRSIEYSLTNIYSKLNIGTRMEAVLIAKSEGIID